MVAQLTCKEQIYKEFRALFCMVGENDLCVKHVCFCDKSRLGQKPLIPAPATGHTKITERACVFPESVKGLPGCGGEQQLAQRGLPARRELRP